MYVEMAFYNTGLEKKSWTLLQVKVTLASPTNWEVFPDIITCHDMTLQAVLPLPSKQFPQLFSTINRTQGIRHHVQLTGFCPLVLEVSSDYLEPCFWYLPIYFQNIYLGQTPTERKQVKIIGKSSFSWLNVQCGMSAVTVQKKILKLLYGGLAWLWNTATVFLKLKRSLWRIGSFQKSTIKFHYKITNNKMLNIFMKRKVSP